MVGRVLHFGQVEKCTNDIEMEPGLVILTLVAEPDGCCQMKAHGIDGRLNMPMAAGALRYGAGLARRLQRDRLPITLGLFDRGLTGVLRARAGQRRRSAPRQPSLVSWS